jgi:hypothetical protein
VDENPNVSKEVVELVSDHPIFPRNGCRWSIKKLFIDPKIVGYRKKCLHTCVPKILLDWLPECFGDTPFLMQFHLQEREYPYINRILSRIKVKAVGNKRFPEPRSLNDGFAQNF